MYRRIKIGADPEFEIRDGYYVLEASEVVPCSLRAQIGTDYGERALEFRPTPAVQPRKLAKNMSMLFTKFKKKYSGFKIGVLGDKYSLGGHLHFGMGKRYMPAEALLYMFDKAIGELALTKSGSCRRDNGYECLSAYESNTHGFEYRTPAAGLFRKPAYLILAMKILKSILNFYLKNSKSIDDIYSYHTTFKDNYDSFHNDRNKIPNNIKLDKIVKSINKRILTNKDLAVLKEFKRYKPNEENIIQYWV